MARNGLALNGVRIEGPSVGCGETGPERERERETPERGSRGLKRCRLSRQNRKPSECVLKSIK